MTPRALGVFQTAVSAICFGAMAILARHAYAEGTDVVALLLVRFGLASAVMVPTLAVRGIRWPRGRTLVMLCLMGGVGYVSQSYSFFTALHYASAALVALLLYLHPALVTLGAALLYGHRLTRVRIACVVVALVGTGLVIGGDLSGQALGYGFGLAAACIYALYLLTGHRVLQHEAPESAAAVVMLSATTVFAFVALAHPPSWPVSATGWAALVTISLVSTVGAMLLLFSGVARLGAADASTISTLEPVVTAVLAAVFLGESLAPVQCLGGALVLGAVVVLGRWGAPRR
ncbi:DMT family transporter [Nitrogeniibacter mangrovi]|uniref:DMT family transporter n=1 Tax=Nitrogeniibacter mangrovi TaxID=2016596 RepID=A0A6C1B4U2_9RHOO|nr:DMT family transporter [Nitrogeniibacter mangrovi]QID17885.1 DMT family transporter [Nitrogeniibacter mangrovi]